MKILTPAEVRANREARRLALLKVRFANIEKERKG